MRPRYVVLKQFLTDLDRLLKEAQSAFNELQKQKLPFAPEKVTALFRPVHSIKGMAAMVDEGQTLAKLFHALEDVLPPLIPRTHSQPAQRADWAVLAQRTFDWTQKFIEFHYKKLELWKRFGADEDETQGLMVQVAEAGVVEPLWLPIVELIGVISPQPSPDLDNVLDQLGTPSLAREGLIVEMQSQRYTIWVKSIDAVVKKDKAKKALSLVGWLQNRLSRAA